MASKKKGTTKPAWALDRAYQNPSKSSVDQTPGAAWRSEQATPDQNKRLASRLALRATGLLGVYAEKTGAWVNFFSRGFISDCITFLAVIFESLASGANPRDEHIRDLARAFILATLRSEERDTINVGNVSRLTTLHTDARTWYAHVLAIPGIATPALSTPIAAGHSSVSHRTDDGIQDRAVGTSAMTDTPTAADLEARIAAAVRTALQSVLSVPPTLPTTAQTAPAVRVSDADRRTLARVKGMLDAARARNPGLSVDQLLSINGR